LASGAQVTRATFDQTDGGLLSKRRDQRELTRDEVFVPSLHQLPTIWERDNALFSYRMIRRSGWLGRVFVALQLLFLATALVTGVTGLPWQVSLAFYGLSLSTLVIMATIWILRRLS